MQRVFILFLYFFHSIISAFYLSSLFNAGQISGWSREPWNVVGKTSADFFFCLRNMLKEKLAFAAVLYWSYVLQHWTPAHESVSCGLLPSFYQTKAKPNFAKFQLRWSSWWLQLQTWKQTRRGYFSLVFVWYLPDKLHICSFEWFACLNDYGSVLVVLAIWGRKVLSVSSDEMNNILWFNFTCECKTGCTFWMTV